MIGVDYTDQNMSPPDPPCCPECQQELERDDTVFTCPDCGYTHDTLDDR